MSSLKRPGTARYWSEGTAARIYVNGLRVAEEPNFLFSYNITSLTKGLRAALNRERSNVGRQAYSERVKAILLASTAPAWPIRWPKDLADFAAARTTTRPHGSTSACTPARCSTPTNSRVRHCRTDVLAGGADRAGPGMTATA